MESINDEVNFLLSWWGWPDLTDGKRTGKIILKFR